MTSRSAKNPTGYTIWEGPSLLDGSPIAVVVLINSTNRKTGDIVQTYIIRRDMKPTDAVRTGDDRAICGDCKHRPSTGGACYVVVAQGPTVVYKGLIAGKYPTAMPEDVASKVSGRMVRLGTYGDPAAVPVEVWEKLTAHASGRTGYTHQWKNTNLSEDHRNRLAKITMASVDNTQEAMEARDMGRRYFRIRSSEEAVNAREFICPASEEAGKTKTCASCGACSGTDRSAKASPVIIVHGFRARSWGQQEKQAA
jgi:hypothetical protein